MIWATISSQSCFCWLCRASPFSASKSVINLIFFDRLMTPMCKVISCVVGRACFLWSMHSLGKTLLAFALLHFVLQAQTFLLLQYLFTSICVPVPYNKKEFFVCFFMFLEGHVSLHRTFNFSFFSNNGWAIDLYYCEIEWFALEMNRDHSVVFETAPMYGMVLEKAEEPKIKFPTSSGSSKKQESSRKTYISALLIMLKPLTVWITTNCGKFWRRWEYQTTWPAS